ERTIAGYALCGPNSHTQLPFEGELFAIYLLKEFQGKGLGRQLFIRCLEEFHAKKIPSFLLFVLSSNTGSRKFYEFFKPDYTGHQTVIIDNGQYCDVCYGWNDVTESLKRAKSDRM